MSITYGLKAPPFGRIMHTLDSRDDVFVAPQSIVSVGEILSLARRIARPGENSLRIMARQ
jgi:hypothetical protein